MSQLIKQKRRPPDARAHRQTFISAALRLFRRQGVDKTTMLDVAKEAGLSRRTLFYCFQSKQKLLLGILEEENQESLHRMTGRLEADITDPVEYFLQLIDGDIDFADCFQNLALRRELASAQIMASADIDGARYIKLYRDRLTDKICAGLNSLNIEASRYNIDNSDLAHIIFAIAYRNYHEILHGRFTNPDEAEECLKRSLTQLFALLNFPVK